MQRGLRLEKVMDLDSVGERGRGKPRLAVASNQTKLSVSALFNV